MKNKVIVVYKSKTGFTKKYAQWIAESLHCDIREIDDVSINDMMTYDTIIFGGGLYAIGVNGIKWIKDNYEALKSKKLVVFATGATPPRDIDIKKIWETNLTQEQREHIKTFYFRGGFNYKLLSTGNKVLMSMMKLKLKNEKNPTEDTKGMLQAFDQPIDCTDRTNLEPLFAYLNQESVS